MWEKVLPYQSYPGVWQCRFLKLKRQRMQFFAGTSYIFQATA